MGIKTNLEEINEIKEKNVKMIIRAHGIDKKIYSKEFKHDYYVSCGRAYQNITYAIEEVYQNNFYYQYGGPNRENYYNHFHSHEFSEVINDVFNCFDKFSNFII